MKSSSWTVAAFLPDFGKILGDLWDAKTAELGQWAADKFAYYIAFGWLEHVDPLYMWGARLFALWVIVGVICWFFGGWWPRLRAIGGAMLLVATFGFYTYYRGRKDERDKPWKKKPNVRK